MDNKFKSLTVFKAMPLLTEFYLASNQIASLQGWDQFPVLRVLHLRRNKVEKWDEEQPAHETLSILNLRSNKVTQMDFITQLFQKCEKLDDLNVLNNPVET